MHLLLSTQPYALLKHKACVSRRRAKLLVDSQQLIVLADSVGPQAEPVLICPTPVATAKSAMVVSSVSPLRWLMTAVQPARFAILIASKVSVSVPIWFSLIRIEFAQPSSIPFGKAFGIGNEQVVADKLDFVAEFIGQLLPAVPVVFRQAVFKGNYRILSTHFAQCLTIASDETLFLGSDLKKLYMPRFSVEHLGGGRVKGDSDILAGLVAGLLYSIHNHFHRLFVALERSVQNRLHRRRLYYNPLP